MKNILNRNRMCRNITLLVIMCFGSLLLILSILTKGNTGHSLFTQVFGKHTCMCNIRDFIATIINPKALQEITKTIGLCSFTIAFIYGSLDKTESGLSYSSLLECLYPHYHYFVVIHIAAIIAALWQSSLESREGTIIALLIVGIDFIPQWISLLFLVLSSSKRKQLAEKRWYMEIESLKKQYDNCDHSNSAIIKKAHNRMLALSDAVSSNFSGNHRYTISCLTESLYQYVIRCDTAINKKKDPIDDIVNMLAFLENMWEHLMASKNSKDRTAILQDIIIISRKYPLDDSLPFIRAMGMSYVSWLYRFHLDNNSNKSLETTMVSLLTEIILIEKNYFSRKNQFLFWTNYIETSFSLIIWIHYFLSHIPLLPDYLELEPAIKPSEKEYIYWQAFAELHTLDRIDNIIVKNALHQISISTQSNPSSFTPADSSKSSSSSLQSITV